jgi:hypothetical protein
LPWHSEGPKPFFVPKYGSIDSSPFKRFLSKLLFNNKLLSSPLQYSTEKWFSVVPLDKFQNFP